MPAHTCDTKGLGSPAANDGRRVPAVRRHTIAASVVIGCHGDAGAQLGHDLLFGLAAGMQLATVLFGLTQIIKGGVDTVQRDPVDRREQKSVHVELTEFGLDVLWGSGPRSGLPVDDGGAGSLRSRLIGSAARSDSRIRPGLAVRRGIIRVIIQPP